MLAASGARVPLDTAASSGFSPTVAAPRGTSLPSTATQAEAPRWGDASDESVRARRGWGTTYGARRLHTHLWHVLAVGTQWRSVKRALPCVLFFSNYQWWCEIVLLSFVYWTANFFGSFDSLWNKAPWFSNILLIS
jgi:hypothetical protein